MKLVGLRAAFFLACAVLGAPADSAFASTSSCGSKTTEPAPTQFNVDAGESLYGFSTNGNLYRSDFNGVAPQLLAKHQFGSEVNFIRSPDKRWIAYSGSLGLTYEASHNNLKADQLWLYDTKTDSKRLILERTAWSLIGVKAGFSPDSKWLATTSDLDSRHPSDKTPGIFVIDVLTGKRVHLGYPRGITPGKDVYSGIEWSRDGIRLLLHIIEQGSKRSYYSINPKTRVFQQISGSYPKNSSAPVFQLWNQKIELLEKYRPQSRRGYGKLSYGETKAHIDEQHRLVVTDSSGKSRVVAKGSYEQCEGITIRIQGWISKGRYLVYSVSGKSYILDLGTFRQKLLVLGPISEMNYFW